MKENTNPDILTMGFLLALLAFQAQVQLFERCAALVYMPMKRRRLFIVVMFIYIFFLHAKLIQPGRRDEERKRRWILRLLLREKKETESCAALLVFALFLSYSSSFALSVFFPSYFSYYFPCYPSSPPG